MNTSGTSTGTDLSGHVDIKQGADASTVGEELVQAFVTADVHVPADPNDPRYMPLVSIIIISQVKRFACSFAFIPGSTSLFSLQRPGRHEQQPRRETVEEDTATPVVPETREPLSSTLDVSNII